MADYVIGIDVGTGSVRGALVDENGKISKTFTEAITTWNPKPDFYQQSSTEIWSICCKVIKKLIENISSERIKGIGFDATCSLAVFDADGQPLAVDIDGDDNQNVILWMDHRAKEEANIINKTKHDILKYVGGNISPEMMTPKILWLKKNHPQCYEKAEHYFLLPDFLTWKATNEDYRSLCSVVCKCNYKASSQGISEWPEDYFNAIGMGDLAEDNWKKIGSRIINPGSLCGKLTRDAAEETGLLIDTPVAASLIDAHAGGVALMGCAAEGVSSQFSSRLALISGTSTCHMWQTKNEVYVPGVWGPYFNAMIPSYWLLEGGQSVSGRLIDHIIETHPATNKIKQNIGDTRISNYLNNLLHEMAKKSQLDSFDELTADLHIWPDFHGNRSPIADPDLRGVIVGLSLASDEENLALLYLATIQALAYGTKHILEEIERNSNGMKIESILICGGLSHNEVFVQTHANAMGLPVLVPKETESVLLGSAILGASVSGFYPDMETAILKMAGSATRISSDGNPNVSQYHAKKYLVFFELLSCQRKCQELMTM